LNLLAELKVQQSMSKQKFIGMHLYMTDSKYRNSSFMQLLADIISSIPDVSMRRIVEEMFLNIKKGRPNWTSVIFLIFNNFQIIFICILMKLLKEIKENSKHPDNIGIYFCGNKNIGDMLKIECLNLKLKYSQENF
jgi:hypothetical protein